MKISDEIAPDPNIKVGIKSGKMIKGIKVPYFLIQFPPNLMS